MNNRLLAKIGDKHHSYGDDVNTSVFVSIFLLFFGVFAILVSFRSEDAVKDSVIAAEASGILESVNKEDALSVSADSPDRLINSMASIHSDVRQNFVRYEEGVYDVIAFKMPMAELFSLNGALPKPEMRFFVERLSLFAKNNSNVRLMSGSNAKMIIDISLGDETSVVGSSRQISLARLNFLLEQLGPRFGQNIVFRQGLVDAKNDQIYVSISLPKVTG